MKGNPSGGQNSETCTGLFTLLRRRSGQCCTDSWAVASGLAGWPGPWKEHDWKIGDKEVWGRGMWMGSL